MLYKVINQNLSNNNNNDSNTSTKCPQFIIIFFNNRLNYSKQFITILEKIQVNIDNIIDKINKFII